MAKKREMHKNLILVMNYSGVSQKFVCYSNNVTASILQLLYFKQEKIYLKHFNRIERVESYVNIDFE